MDESQFLLCSKIPLHMDSCVSLDACMHVYIMCKLQRIICISRILYVNRILRSSVLAILSTLSWMCAAWCTIHRLSHEWFSVLHSLLGSLPEIKSSSSLHLRLRTWLTSDYCKLNNHTYTCSWCIYDLPPSSFYSDLRSNRIQDIQPYTFEKLTLLREL